jgi:CelD/BcsL family acetyltransferase involved in cellulose biosynthesis
MRLECHAGIDSVAAEWDELALRLDAPPWLRPAWFEAWHAAFGNGVELQVFATRAAGRLSGVLPMLRRGRRLFSPANWHSPAFGPLASDPEAQRGLVEGVLEGRPRTFTLSWIPAEGLEPMRSAVSRAGYLAAERVLMRSPYLPLDSDSGDKTPRASTVRRHRRKLEQEGKVLVNVEPGIDSLEEGLQLEASGWKGERGTAIISNADTRSFYEQIARWAADQGILRLFFLKLDDRPIAFVFALEDNGALYYVKGGFDVELRRFGPGVIMTHEMIAYARAHRLGSFEFLGGEDQWKLEWTSELRERRLFQAFARDAVGAAAWALYAFGRPAAKAVVSSVRR